MFARVGREGDTGNLEDAADLAGDGGSGGDALAVLLDGGLQWKLVRPWKRPGEVSRVRQRSATTASSCSPELFTAWCEFGGERR